MSDNNINNIDNSINNENKSSMMMLRQLPTILLRRYMNLIAMYMRV